MEKKVKPKLPVKLLIDLPYHVAAHLSLMANRKTILRKRGVKKMLRKEYIETVLITLAEKDIKRINNNSLELFE